MSRAVVIVLLLLSPSLVVQPAEQPAEGSFNFIGQTFVLAFNEPVTFRDWIDVGVAGFEPLRTISPFEILAWKWADDPAVWAGEQWSPVHAEWRSELKVQTYEGPIKVVFEPHMPFEAIQAMMQRLDAYHWQDVRGYETASYAQAVVLNDTNGASTEMILAWPGVAWVEPILPTNARNMQSSALMQTGDVMMTRFWDWGINGNGTMVGVADSGIDADHACFRAFTSLNEGANLTSEYPLVGEIGPHHRKIVFINTSIDGNDNIGHEDYRHGTHVAGSLGCADVYSDVTGSFPANASTIGYGTKLVIQDIVSSQGWMPPPVDELLYEASRLGVVIHSNSWGDATTAYTERSGRFDAYAMQMPWSLALIAPGNSGGSVLEPANARNVISVGAIEKSEDLVRWSSSAHGPTEIGTDGIFILAPGVQISSAMGDGNWSTGNNGVRLSTGTSMSTPLVASASTLIQQLVEEGWIFHASDMENLSFEQPNIPMWSDAEFADSGIPLAHGFTPSNALMKSLLALAATPLPDEIRNNGQPTSLLHNPYDGWGALNLSELLNVPLGGKIEDPFADLWIHDSFQLTEGNMSTWFDRYSGNQSNIDGFGEVFWDGVGARGPFLQTGDSFTQTLTIKPNSDIRIRLSYPALPEPYSIDDLILRVELENGKVLLADKIDSEGLPIEFYASAVNAWNVSSIAQTNETTLGINIPSSMLQNMSHVKIDVLARFVQPGPHQLGVGIDGNRRGFALAVQGVLRNSTDFLDDDGDGFVNYHDRCPSQNSLADDADEDGCLDDNDEDGIPNIIDVCPEIHPGPYDVDLDGCVDDSDGDGVDDSTDECQTPDLNWTVLDNGCYPEDGLVELSLITPLDPSFVWRNVLEFSWEVSDPEDDEFATWAEIQYSSQNGRVFIACTPTELDQIFSCRLQNPTDLPPYVFENERFDIFIFAQSSNQSPVGNTEVQSLQIPVNLSILVTEDGGLTSQESGVNETFLGIFLGVLCCLLFIYTHRRRQSVRRGHNSPFIYESLDVEEQ